MSNAANHNCSTGVILSAAKDLTIEGEGTLDTQGDLAASKRFLAPLGMTCEK
jgi:hypothetical protein